jgi:SAM-dependent methyltransferase
VDRLTHYLWAVEVLRERGSKRILDIACGAGYGTYLLARDVAGATVLGVDDDREGVEHMRDSYSHQRLSYSPGVATQWGFGEFDAIVCFDTIERERHREIMLQNFVDHLALNGCLLLSTRIGERLELSTKGDPHEIGYSPATLLDFLRRYFQRILRPEDGSLPALRFFDSIDADRPRYHLLANPLVCEGPIRLPRTTAASPQRSLAEADCQTVGSAERVGSD